MGNAPLTGLGHSQIQASTESAPRLSVVIPAYNEAERIGDTLDRIYVYLHRQDYPFEVIVADDGSSDATAEIVRQSYPQVRLITYSPNRGKGYAVKTGMLAAGGGYRVFYDADASTPIEEIEKLWRPFEQGAGVVIGSRSIPGAEIEIRQAWYRESMGRVFNLFVRLLGLTRFPDTQCGFKGFTAAAAVEIFPRQTIDRFSFDAEVLYIAQIRGIAIAQVPVRWLNCPLTRVNPVYDSSQMILDLIKIRLRALRGAYR